MQEGRQEECWSESKWGVCDCRTYCSTTGRVFGDLYSEECNGKNKGGEVTEQT